MLGFSRFWKETDNDDKTHGELRAASFQVRSSAFRRKFVPRDSAISGYELPPEGRTTNGEKGDPKRCTLSCFARDGFQS